MSKRASANESTSAEEEAKEGGGEDRVEEEGAAAAAAAATALWVVDLAAAFVLIVRLMGCACAGVARVVAATMRGNLGDEARGDEGAPHGSVEKEEDESAIATSFFFGRKKSMRVKGGREKHIRLSSPLLFFSSVRSSFSLSIFIFSEPMRRLSGAVALARAAAALALKEETIAARAAARSSMLPRASSIAFAARPCVSFSSSASSSAASWRLHQQTSPWKQQQQQQGSTLLPSCARAASNSAAPSSAAAREDEEEGVDDSSASASASTTKHDASPAVSASAAAAAAAASTSSPIPAVSYVAPLSTTVHRLKRLSLFSCLLTTAAAPTLAATEAMPPAARAAAAAGIAGFGLFTTGLLHWFVGPYVHELTWRGGGEEGAIELTTLDFLGAKRTRSLPLSRVAAPPEGSVHPQATFSDSETGRLYYVDVDNFVSVASGGASGGASGASGGSGGGRARREERERAAAALLERLVAAEEVKAAEEEGGEER